MREEREVLNGQYEIQVSIPSMEEIVGRCQFPHSLDRGRIINSELPIANTRGQKLAADSQYRGTNSEPLAQYRSQHARSLLTPSDRRPQDLN